MKFCNLPAEMNVGGAHLTPVNGYATLKEYMCFCCDRMSPSIFVCCNQHVLCKDCCVPESSKRVWCPVCRQTVTANETKFHMLTLDDLLFECACGFAGRLIVMRQHLLEQPTTSEDERVCGTDASRIQHLNKTDRISNEDNYMRDIALEEIGKMKETMIEEFLQRLNNNPTLEHTLASDHDSSMESMVDHELDQREDGCIKETEMRKTVSNIHEKIDSVTEKTKRLEQSVSSLERVVEQCEKDLASEVPVSIPTAYLWFDFEILFEYFVTTRDAVLSPYKSTVIAGVHLEATIQLCNKANEDYLGIFVKFCEGFAGDTPIQLHRKLILKVHDINGTDAATSAYKTVLNGKYYFTKNAEMGHGNPEMITLNSLWAKKCLVDGMICISIGISPME